LQRLVSNVNPQFDYNIFFVQDFYTRTGFNAGTGAYTPRSYNGVELNLCIMPNVAGFQALAHELCHYLLRLSPLKGPGAHSLDRRDLMVDAPGLDSVWIPKDQANAINPSGKP
jgi:predicted SprT family Zn-dependent metalloprotease